MKKQKITHEKFYLLIKDQCLVTTLHDKGQPKAYLEQSAFCNDFLFLISRVRKRH